MESGKYTVPPSTEMRRKRQAVKKRRRAGLKLNDTRTPVVDGNELTIVASKPKAIEFPGFGANMTADDKRAMLVSKHGVTYTFPYIYNTDLDTKDLQTLRTENELEFGEFIDNLWLNDNVLNTLFNIFNEEHPDMWCADTRMIDHLMANPRLTEKKIKAIAKRSNMGAKTHIFLPVHEKATHWSFVHVDVTAASVTLWDSLNSDNNTHQSRFYSPRIKIVLVALKHWFNNISNWKVKTFLGPKQTNGYDCGLFVYKGILSIAECVKTETHYVPHHNFSQADVSDMCKCLPLFIADHVTNPTRFKKQDSVDRYGQEIPPALSPRCAKTYWQTIKHNVRHTRIMLPYFCELHKSEPLVKQQYKELLDMKYTGPRDEEKENERLLRCHALYQKLQTIQRHKEQFDSQRKFIKKLRDDLPARTPERWEVVVYEDFVSDFNSDGGKIAMLVLTIEWNDENGHPVRKFVDNVCSDSSRTADSFYVRHVWRWHLEINRLDHLLKQGGLTLDEKEKIEAERTELLKKRKDFGSEFRGVTRIVRTGDSGPHFHSRFTMEFESTAHEKYGCKWETHTLCKHHAYNLCDAHGGSIKRFVKAHAVRSQRSFSAEDYCMIVNGTQDQAFADARAYAFKNIDRSDKQTLPAMLRDMNGMKACCEFQYNSKNESGEFVPTSHVVRMRMCSGSTEPYKTFLLKRQPHKGR